MDAPKPAERQPPAFALLLLLQGGERFAYYGARTLLALFLMDRLGLATATLAQVFALFSGVTVLAPLLGGYLADRVLGPRQVLLAGLALSAVGALLLGAGLQPFIALGLLAVGTGLVRPSLLVLLSQLYRQGDPRRDSGFTWLHVATNAAALLAPVLFGMLRMLGPGSAILAGGLLMTALLVIAAAGQRLLPADGYEPGEDAAPRAYLSARDVQRAALGALAVALLVAAAVPLGAALAPTISPGALLFGAAVALLLLAYGVERARAAARRDAHRPLDAVAWQRLLVLALLAVLTVPAWVAASLQSRVVTASIFHGRDSTWLYGLQGLCILIAGPILATAWRRLDGPRPDGSWRRVSGLVKLAGGMLVTGAGVAMLLATGGGAGATIPVIAMSALLTALGELCLVPIGQAMVTKLAPARSAAMAMGAWLSLAALGSVLLPALVPGAGDPGPLLIVGVAAVVMVAGGLLLALGPRLRGWMHGAEDPAPARTWGIPYRGAGPRADAAEAEAAEAALAAQADAMPARRMAVGALWALGGVVVTVGSFAAAEGGGPYVMAHGAIVYGVITFLRGLAGWGSKRP